MQLNVKLNVSHHTTYGLRNDAKLQQTALLETTTTHHKKGEVIIHDQLAHIPPKHADPRETVD